MWLLLLTTLKLVFVPELLDSDSGTFFRNVTGTVTAVTVWSLEGRGPEERKF